MPDIRRVSVFACVALVTLRLFIGWQLLHEGLWKTNTMDSARPWSGEGFLANAHGPLRDQYRSISGDPDSLDWLDYDKVADRWIDWKQRFIEHHPDLSESQLRKLNELVDGYEDFRAELVELPEAVEFPPKGVEKGAIRFEPDSKRLIVDGKLHLTQRERNRLITMAHPDWKDGDELPSEYAKAVDLVFKRAQRLGYLERLAAVLKGDPERITYDVTDRDGEVMESFVGEIDVYRAGLKKYNEDLAEADQAFEYDHLASQWKDLQEQRLELISPVVALETEMHDTAAKMLTIEQLSRGPVPEPWTMLRISDAMVITGLCTLGTLLIIGFATRFAAASAAILVLSFYLVWPPWPGVPEPPGTEHSLIVNKNLIEVAALISLAALPTGTWFGVDGIIGRLFAGRKQAKQS
ncbi:hypothetical protein [Stratiformator vulcanicus]|uniref:hypothetical protein n=1 Tax=Stratiformator vulcanicus TaxID=2527980 RepID=UPI00119EA67D|nr:hypothetical protein [Stratiformator vulcanicus]